MELVVSHLIRRMVDNAPMPVKVRKDCCGPVLQFFEDNTDHKGIVEAGQADSNGTRLLGVMMPDPKILKRI